MITVGEVFQLIQQHAPRIREDKTIREALDVLLEDTRTSSVFVVDEDDTLLGIIDIAVLLHLAESINREFEKNETISTDSEAFLHMLGNLLASYRVSQIMKSPVSVGKDESISHAIFLMKEHHVNELPVVEEGKLIGILNFCEVLYNLKK
jgi:CBS domain-containing protein